MKEVFKMDYETGKQLEQLNSAVLELQRKIFPERFKGQ